jgi:nucleoid-associated protein EbfC
MTTAPAARGHAAGGSRDRASVRDAHLGTTMNNIQQILQMGQQVQARLSQLQTELGQKTVSCSSGGGMVTATADGRGKLRSLKIDPNVLEGGDVEMLEDLVLAAVSEAQNRAGEMYEEEMRKLSGGLPFPVPGL